MLIFSRQANPPPAYFDEVFAGLWRELNETFRPSPQLRLTQELAVLLLADLRSTGPDWPTERYRALAELLRRLGG